MKSHYWETSGGDTELYLSPEDEAALRCPICGGWIDTCGCTEEDWQALNYPGY